MSIFLNAGSRGIGQGITGPGGRKHPQRMLSCGTTVGGGGNPKKAGQKVDFDDASVPVFGSVADAIVDTGADVTVIFVPPAGTKAAVMEAIDASIGLCVIITEGVPVHDTASF